MYIHYIIVLCMFLLGLFFINRKNGSQLFVFIFFLILLVIAAFRDSTVGNDTTEYVRQFNAYKGLPDLKYNLEISRYEFGFVLLNTVIKTFTSSYTVLLLIVSGLYLYAISNFIKKYSRFIWLSVFIFYTLGVYFLIFNVVRQCIAISIFLISIDYIIKGKPLKYVLSILCATLFHSSAIVLLPLYMLRKRKVNGKLIITILVILPILLISLDNIMTVISKVLPGYYHYYDHSKYSIGGTRLATILRSVFFILILVLGKLFNSNSAKINKNVNNITKDKLEIDNFFEMLVVINVVVLLISLKFNLIDRIGDYFIAITTVYFPNTIIKIGKLAYVVSYLVIIVSFLYITTTLYYRPEWSGIFPYKFI